MNRFLLLTAAVVLTSCGTFPHFVDSKTIKPKQIVVIGKVVVTPPILEFTPTSKNDSINPNAVPADQGKVTPTEIGLWVTFSAPGSPTADGIGNNVQSNRDYAMNNETFFIAAPQDESLNMLGFAISDYPVLGYFPSGSYIKVPEGARAIYVGTFVYERDDFYRVKSMKRKDDYDEALVEFQQKFPGWELVRADWAPLK